MTNREFDDFLRSRVAGMEASSNNGGWDTFKEKLYAEQQEEQSREAIFDQLVKNKVSAHNPTGLHRNWSFLALRLNLILRREKQLFAAKALEFISVILLLLVINKDFILDNTVPITCCPEQTDRAELSIKTSSGTIESSIPADLTEVDQEISRYQIPLIAEPEIVSMEPLATTGLLPSLSSQVVQSHVNQADLSLNAEVAPTTVSPLPASSIKEISMPKRKQAGQILRYKSRPFVSLSMMGSSDINRIMTPVFMENDDVIPSSDRLALGYSGGFSIGVGRQRFTLESGLIYTAKQYLARPVIYVTGSTADGFHGEGLTDIELNMISVPLQVRYDVIRRHRWHVYGLVGSALMVSLENNFAIADQEAFISSHFNPPPGGSHGPVTKSTGLQNRNLTGGVLQGGSFRNNSYVTMNMGIGIERKFLEGWSLFVQPSYQHSVLYFSRGLGPELDRIHTFSIFSGIKLRL
jgi:hypothetical protein